MNNVATKSPKTKQTEAGSFTYGLYKSEYSEEFLNWLKAKFDYTETPHHLTLELQVSTYQEALEISNLIGCAMWMYDEGLEHLKYSLICKCPWL